MSNIIKRFIKDESGATMVEYAILVALIAVAVIVTVSLLGQKIDDTFNTVIDKLETTNTPTTPPATNP